jgi:RecA/RadA recombinase
MALNAIISGSLYKGIPKARITGFSGPSQTGKSLICKKVIAEAQKAGYFAVVFDSEVAFDGAGSELLGIDTKRVKYYPVETVEQCRNQMSRWLDNIIEANKSNPGKTPKMIGIIDSLGNLASTKELEDAAKGKDAADMGLRAKALKSMMRVLTYKSAKAGVPIVFTNHTYDDPAATNPSLVKNMSGGKGAVYMSSVLVQLGVKQEKNDEVKEKMKKMFAKKNGKEYTAPEADDSAEEVNDTIAISHNINGVTLSALTVKNRFVPPFLKTEVYLNFKTGLDKYAGLLDMAQAFEIVESGVTWKWAHNGESIGYRKNFEKDPEFWKKLLPLLEAKLNKELTYNNTNIAALQAEVDDLAKEAAAAADETESDE